MRRVICDIINSDELFQARDVCKDGLEAYERLKTTHYDAVILDVNMPKMDGLELLEKLQEEKIDATVIMVSTLTTKDAKTTILAIERGAVDFVPKPTNIIEAKGDAFKQHLLAVLTAVIDSRKASKGVASAKGTMPRPAQSPRPQTQPATSPGPRTQPVATPKPAASPVSVARPVKKTANGKLVALACSTGGPKALQSVIPYLPKEMDAPLVLVQHMPVGFTKSMADRLDELSQVNVKEAENGDILEKGTVYVAPGGNHMLVKRSQGGHKIVLSDAPAIGGLKPCANLTYESLVDCGYDEIVCVVLTGMGADGTEGILELKQHKPIHTIVQNEQTCVVYGMPKSIVACDAADEIVPLDEIAQTIIKNVGVK